MPVLNWIGKDAVVAHDAEVPFRLLHDAPELACGDGDNGNLIVEGDNLLALKALLPHYGGQVKCIYIDPPYNTGNEGWVYNDNVNSPQMREWLGKVVGKEAEDLTRHDKWLCMMYPRLKLLKRFLREDGAIFVSIDDNEVASLRMLMDEIFGRQRFIACNVWQKRYSRENREAIGDVHEYLLVYAMNPERFKATRNKVPPTGKQEKVYRNPNNDPRGRWRPVPMTAQAGHATPEQFYEIVSPSGKKFRPSPGRCWGIAEATFRQLLSEKRIYFGKNGNSQPNVIRYLSEVEGMVPWTWWPHEEVGNTDESSKELLDIFRGETPFNTTPKPSRLILRVLQIATNSGDLILDSFAGSGTTGHAVLKANAEDGGDRRFILVEMDETIAREVTAERVRRVSSGYRKGKNALTTTPLPQAGEGSDWVAGLGGGFRYATLGKPLFDARGHINPEVRFAELARFVWFMETGIPWTPDPHPHPSPGGRGAFPSPSGRRWREAPDEGSAQSPLLGVHENRAVYLLYNGILKDKSAGGGNVLTSPLLDELPPHDGAKTIYGTRCLIKPDRLRALRIAFKQLPYELKVAR